jgi:hypothetical protein
MSNDFTKRGANAYTEDIVEFGVFHHVSGLGVGEGRIDELDPMLLTLSEGCVSRAVFCALSEGVRKETSLCWLYLNIVSSQFNNKTSDNLDSMRPGSYNRGRVEASSIQATKRFTHCSRMRLRPCGAQGASCAVFAVNFPR